MEEGSVKSMYIAKNKSGVSRGFTLVELSIVLVIIGLIVGGVVGGQALVNSARVQSVIKDINKYKIAVKAFELQYDSLPGDMADAEDYWGSVSNCGSTNPGAGSGTQTCNGNGNNKLDFYNESWRAWEHLQNADILPGNLTGIATIAAGSGAGNNAGNLAGGNVPASAYANSLFVLLRSGGKNILAFGSSDEGPNPPNTYYHDKWYNAVLSPKDAKNIDTKIDDGKPYTGKVVDFISGGVAVTPNCTDTEVVATAKFNLSRSTPECLLLIDL